MAQEGNGRVEYLSVWPPPKSSPPIKTKSENQTDIEENEHSNKESKTINIKSFLKRHNDENDEVTITAESLLASWWRNKVRVSKIGRFSNDKLCEIESEILQIECLRAKINAIKRHPLEIFLTIGI